MGNEILGTGWAFPLLPDTTGALRYSSAELNIEQALELVLLTHVGERVMRPAFGSEVRTYVFAPGSERYHGLVKNAAREAVRDFEPRVELLDVQVADDTVQGSGVDPDHPEQVLVSIDYRVRRTNAKANLVFPFYLSSRGR
jgi:phage baseplate assembly protein W